jgi:hypothetical protein
MNANALYLIADEYLQAVSTLSDLDLPDDVIADTLESLQYLSLIHISEPTRACH